MFNENPWVDFAKVTYIDEEDNVSQAYIDLNTMTGENKHTDEPLTLERLDEPVFGKTGLVNREVWYRKVN